MKKFLSILLAALCAFLPLFAQAEDSTILITTVPSEHVITIVCHGHGGVMLGDVLYTGTHSFTVARLGTLVMHVMPDEGYALEKVRATSLDGLTLKDGGLLTLESIHCDNRVTLTFGEEPVPPFYDEVLGSDDSDVGISSIVFDGEYAPESFDLLAVTVEDSAPDNLLLVHALPDENGETMRRSLMLTAAQLATFAAQEEPPATLAFENGDAGAVVLMSDLVDGDLNKLLSLIVSGDEPITDETLNRDWSAVEAEPLDANQLQAFRIEVRIEPVTLPDSREGWDMSTWLHWGNEELEISSLLPSLRCYLNVDALVTEENRLTFADMYRIAYCVEDTEDTLLLQGELLHLPDDLPEEHPDTAERLSLRIDEEGHATAAYTSEASLSAYRHEVLAVTWAGAGLYWLEAQP